MGSNPCTDRTPIGLIVRDLRPILQLAEGTPVHRAKRQVQAGDNGT